MGKKNPLIWGIVAAIVAFFFDAIVTVFPITTEGAGWVCGGHLSCVLAPIVRGIGLGGEMVTPVFALLVGILVWYLVKEGYV